MPVDALPAAFSVPSQVETVGALAGLAAILGLAVLSMLYFAQARELKRLREWAGRAPERAAELQSQATAGVPRRVTPQPVPNRAAQRTPTPVPTPRPAGAPAPGAPAAAGAAGATAAAAAAAAKPGATAAPGAAGAPGTPPAAPGTGKPATAAATAAAAGTTPANGQTGTPGAPATPASPDEAAKPGEEAAQPAQAPAGETKPAAALDDTMIGAPPSDDEETGEQATTAQPAAKPAVPQPLPVPPGARTQPPRPATPATPAARPATPRPRAAAPLRSTSPSATIPPRGGGRGAPPAGGDGPSRGLRIGLVVGAIVLVLAAGIFAFTQLTGGDGDKTSGSRTATAKTTREGNTIAPSGNGNAKTTDEAAQPKGETTVAVLNGTTVPGLARGVADKLLAAGYKIGTVTNAPDQQRAATQVAYASGQQATARQVARTIDAGTDAIAPIDEVTQATAGSDAMIVVTVGADQSP
jgi:hypothetical protein